MDVGMKTWGADQGTTAVRKGTVENTVASKEYFQLHGYIERKQVGEKLFLIPGIISDIQDPLYLSKAVIG